MKYGPNGDLRDANVKANRVHKSHSTRDVFYRDGSGHVARREPFVEYPPTLPRNGFDSPPRSGLDHPLTKARSYADWDERRRFPENDMTRLENGLNLEFLQ